MKYFSSILGLAFCIALTGSANAQNVGVGTGTPLAPLHVSAAQPEILRVENTTPLASAINTEFYFKTGSWFTGALKTIGTSNQAARLGFYTFASGSSAGLKERVTITDNGNVGINQIAPTAQLDVAGAVKITDGTQGANKVLTSDANGLAAWKSLPAGVTFGASQASGFPVANNTDILLPFSSETYDPGSNFSSGIFTVPATGVYHFDADVPSTGVLLSFFGSFTMELRVNNNAVRVAEGKITSGSAYPGMSISCDLSLAAGNTVAVSIRQFNSGGNSFVVGGSSDARNPHFSGHKVN